MEKLRDATLLFLIKNEPDKPREICLAMKKIGFGQGRWNGVGGKVEAGRETIEEAARREAREEIGINPGAKLLKVAELSFFFPHNSAWNQTVHVFFCEDWQGKPAESDEMAPKWFKEKEIPWKMMWPSDTYWFPTTLAGNRLRASIMFGENDVVNEAKISLVDGFFDEG